MYNAPPQSIETEESILASMLIHPDSVETCVEGLSPDDMYKTAHQIIFQAMKDLHGSGQPVDLPILVNKCRENAQLEKIGGAAYIARLLDSPVPGNIGAYIRTIKDKAILREIIQKANDTIQKVFESRDGAERLLNDAQKAMAGITYDGISEITRASDTIFDVISDMETRKHGKISGIPTGWSKLDYLIGGLNRAKEIILAGRTSMGKTTVAMNIVKHATVFRGVPAAVFSLEMEKEALIRKFIGMVGKINTGKFLQNTFTKQDWEAITEASEKIHKAPLWIDDRSGLTCMQIRRVLRKLVKSQGVKYAVIDYLQLMAGDKSGGRNLEVGEMAREVKGMAKEFDIPIILLSQLNRSLESRSDKRPMLSDLRDSGELEQHADIVMFVYRDEVYYDKEEHNGTAELLIRKHREGETGCVPLRFFKEYQLFAEPDYDYKEYQPS